KLTDQLFIFDDGGYVRIYNGNYTDYGIEQDEEKRLLKELPQKEIKKGSSKINDQKLSFKEQKELEELDIQIPEMESQIRSLSKEMDSGISDHTRLIELAQKIKALQDLMEK